MPGHASEIEEVLAACLDDLAAGATPAQCLERYAAYAEELKPLLSISDRLYARWPAMSAGARARGRERMHRALDERPPRFFGWLPLWEQAVAVVLIIASLSAAWLAWPGRVVRKTTAPPSAVTVQPMVSPTLPSSPVAPTATPPQQIVAPVSTAESSLIAPRTATPSMTPTPTRRPTATASPAAWHNTYAPAVPAQQAKDAAPAAQPTNTIAAPTGPTSPVLTPAPAATPDDIRPPRASKAHTKNKVATAKSNKRPTPKPHATGSKRSEELKDTRDPLGTEPPQRAPRAATPHSPGVTPDPTEALPVPPVLQAPPAARAPAIAEPKSKPSIDGNGKGGHSAPPPPKDQARPEKPADRDPPPGKAKKG